ncbi:putative germin-like protein 2-3 [Bidens hawaiensis]|uniref:putative germin-like protein 2-3 n=1 Tax=Bidens hawaiensis TaxID=980011 RepID=UPI00404A9E4F
MYIIVANSDGIYSCKDPRFINVNDFSFSRLHIPPTTTNKKRGRILTQVFDRQLPGLNTLGISMLMFDYAAGDFVTSHSHDQSTEILAVLRGRILLNMNTSAHEKHQFTKVVRKGGVFVVPKGLCHSVKNVGKTDALVIAALTQQSPNVKLSKH